MKPLEQYAVYALPVDRIYYDPDFNCRGEFTLQSVSELAESIKDIGRLIYPVTVQPWTAQPGYDYRLIAGHRRYKAMTVFLKATTIPAVIVNDLTDHEARLLNVLENLQRKDLNIMEEARALERLYPHGVTLRQAAKELKQNTHWVHVRLRLLRMPLHIQQKAAAGLLSATNIDTLAGIDKPEDQLLATTKIAEAHKRGGRHRLPGLERKYKKSRVRTRDEINALVERMLLAGIDGLAPRVGAWCAGNIDDEEIAKEIEAATPKTLPKDEMVVRASEDE
jgi:ParB family chromosome partitioning protein